MKYFLNLIPSTMFLFFSCARPNCTNTNPVFNQFTPDRKEYKQELWKEMQLRGMENLRYWFEKSFMISGQEFYELDVQSEKLCAKLIVLNRDERRSLGNGGYRGTELRGVKIRAENKNGEINFVLDTIDKIWD